MSLIIYRDFTITKAAIMFLEVFQSKGKKLIFLKSYFIFIGYQCLLNDHDDVTQCVDHKWNEVCLEFQEHQYKLIASI